MYTAVNEEVHKARTDADAVKEAEYFKWMMKQRTYYGDLLKAGKVTSPAWLHKRTWLIVRREAEGKSALHMSVLRIWAPQQVAGWHARCQCLTGS